MITLMLPAVAGSTQPLPWPLKLLWTVSLREGGRSAGVSVTPEKAYHPQALLSPQSLRGHLELLLVGLSTRFSTARLCCFQICHGLRLALASPAHLAFCHALPWGCWTSFHVYVFHHSESL